MDETAERAIRAGLQIPGPPTGPGGAMVEVPLPDGGSQTVPAEVGVYLAVSNIAAVQQQLMIRLDAIHHHLASRVHPRSQEHQTCNVCLAHDEAIELMKQQESEQGEKTVDDNGEVHQDANVVAGGFGVGAQTPGVG